MNPQQVTAFLQIILAAGGPVSALITSYGVSPDQLHLWEAAAQVVLPPLIAGVWALWERTHRNQIIAVATNPEISRIEVAANASNGAKSVADDPQISNVKKAA